MMIVMLFVARQKILRLQDRVLGVANQTLDAIISLLIPLVAV
jgi:hypothetical protein